MSSSLHRTARKMRRNIGDKDSVKAVGSLLPHQAKGMIRPSTCTKPQAFSLARYSLAELVIRIFWVWFLTVSCIIWARRTFFQWPANGTLMGRVHGSGHCLHRYRCHIQFVQLRVDLPSGANRTLRFVVSDRRVRVTSLLGTEEGRAMMPRIYDVAPGASRAFRTAFRGPADFAVGILDLARAGCDCRRYHRF
jgi:hypothetical protein